MKALIEAVLAVLAFIAVLIAGYMLDASFGLSDALGYGVFVGTLATSTAYVVGQAVRRAIA